MKAIGRYKDMVEEVGRMLSIFAGYESNEHKGIVDLGRWTTEVITSMQANVENYAHTAAAQIKDELIGDGDEAKFMGRLKTAFFELREDPYFVPSYFPRFDEALFGLPTKDYPDRNRATLNALAAVYGNEAKSVMVSLQAIAQWANVMVQDVAKMLDDVCSFVGYTPEVQEQQQDATNTNGLADAVQEPQQEEQQNGVVLLPDVLNTQKTKAIFDEALKRSWMQPNGKGGYKWLGLKGHERGKQQQLVYMIGQMFGYKKGPSGNDGNDIPCKALEKLFGVSGIYSLLITCWNAAKPQAWRQPIDDMIDTVLKNMTASTSK